MQGDQATQKSRRRVWQILVFVGMLLWFTAATVVSPGSLSWASTTGGHSAIVVVATMALCILPGIALLQTLWPDIALNWAERLALAWGIGAGLPPLLLMLVHLLRLNWPVWATPLYVAGAALLVLWLVWGRSLWRARKFGLTWPNSQLTARPLPSATSTQPHNQDPWYTAMFVGLTLLALFARLFTIRDLLVGPNVDSYHHTLIAQLLVDNRGLFTSWEPYAPLSTFTYHYGFHSIVAFVHDLTGWPVWKLEPIVGQVLAAGIVPLMAVLSAQLTASRTVGLWAALLVGFVNNQPAYYIFWGRFTFATSHLILIALLVCWIAAIEAPRRRSGLIVLSALSCAALAHTHYQTTLLAVVYLAIYMSIVMLRSSNIRAALPALGRATLIVAVALVIAAPWLLNTISGDLDRNVRYSSEQQSVAKFAGLPMPAITPFFLHRAVLPLMLIGLIFGLRLRRWRIVMLAAWALASILVAFPYAFALPGTGILEPFVAAMILYLCVLPVAAFPLGLLQDRLTAQHRFGPAPSYAGPINTLCAIVIMVVSIVGLQWQRDLIPAYDHMVTAGDMQAFDWVRHNTPADARFYVQNHPVYGGMMIVGTDAGWWLPLMAGRQTNVPPMTYGSEQSMPADWGAQANKLAARVRRSSLTNLGQRSIDLSRSDIREALQQAQIRYVYIGAQPLQGENTIASTDRIDIEKLRNNPAFRLVYDTGGVLIFEMVTTQ